MNPEENAALLLEVFSAIERRDDRRFQELLDPEFEICWPASLPYGGTFRGPTPEGPTWGSTWIPLQPTDAERRMDARVVATGGDQVVVLWRQRGRSPSGARVDAEVLGLYTVRDRKLVRAQMFYFDTVDVARFLAGTRATASLSPASLSPASLSPGPRGDPTEAAAPPNDRTAR